MGMMAAADLPPLPDYLVEVVAREHYAKDVRTTPWEDASEAERTGAREAARLILRARAAQSDIPR